MLRINPVNFNLKNNTLFQRKKSDYKPDFSVLSRKNTPDISKSALAKSKLLNIKGNLLLDKADNVIKSANHIQKVAAGQYICAYDVISDAKRNNFAKETDGTVVKNFIKSENGLCTMYESNKGRVTKCVVFNPETLMIYSISLGLDYSDKYASRQKIFKFKAGKLSNYIENTTQIGNILKIGAQYDFDDNKLAEYSKGIIKSGNNVKTKLGFYFENQKLSECKLGSSMDNTGLYIKEFYTFKNRKLVEYSKNSMPYSADLGEYYALNKDGFLVKYDE